MLKKLWHKWGPNPLDFLLKRAAKKKIKRVLITWNRGMGDVPLGMYALIYRIRQFISDVKIVFLVRGGLKDAFSLLEGIDVVAAEHWKRGASFDLESTLEEVGIESQTFDMILENPDPTHWLKWQLGTLLPKLRWNPDHDALADQFALPEKNYIALHVHSETTYGYEKNWQMERWKELSERLIREYGATILLFGLKQTEDFSMERVIDLRGKTTLFEMLALIKNRCTHLVAPDSGVLSLVYYLDAVFPLRVVSLWADPRQGVLKQNVDSPNPELQHVPLLGKEEKVENITTDEVVHALQLEVRDPLLRRQQEALFQKKEQPFTASPLREWGIPSETVRGLLALQEGKVGCLVLAGGQGSRLGTHLPKGLVPITPVAGKTLFQLLCEKVQAASIQSKHALPLAVMTSPLNHDLTVAHIEGQGRFGLEAGQVFYFTQEMLPFVDDKGHWLWEAGGKIARGPDGNGRALSLFFRSGIWQSWKELGIEYVNVVMIDNPLADPFDPSLIAAHIESGAEVTLKCVAREHLGEKVGVVGVDAGRIRVVEYTELPEEERGRPDWHLANIGLFCFSMDFIARVADVSLPWHLVRKGGLWKFETFIFDVLGYTDRTKVLLYPREETFAPLKNAVGESSLETVRAALLAAEKRAICYSNPFKVET